MTDQIIESSVWPVNELGEIILDTGDGTFSVQAYLPAGQVPIGLGGRVKFRLPDYLYPSGLGGAVSPYYKLINRVEDFPTPVGGVITLADNHTYVVTTTLDLEGLRLVCGQNTTILGGSSENCRLKSTGLTLPLISSEWSLPIRNITIEAAHAIDLDAGANPNQALDWMGVNFTNCAKVGRIANYTNFIMTDSAFLEAAEMEFDGTIGTVALNASLFNGVPGKSTIKVPATANIARRLRVVYSSFISLSGETSIDVSASAAIPVEGFILDSCNFSGGGTYLTGVDHFSEKALFFQNRGIINTGSIGQYRMTDNAVATTVSLQNTFYKIAGTTLSGDFVEKFTITSNRATYTGALTGYFKVTVVATASSGNNQLLKFRVGLNGTPQASSESKVTTSGSGRSENIKTHTIMSLVTGDFIEVFVANSTAASNVTVSDLNVIIERLN